MYIDSCVLSQAEIGNHSILSSSNFLIFAQKLTLIVFCLVPEEHQQFIAAMSCWEPDWSKYHSFKYEAIYPAGIYIVLVFSMRFVDTNKNIEKQTIPFKAKFSLLRLFKLLHLYQRRWNEEKVSDVSNAGWLFVVKVNGRKTPKAKEQHTKQQTDSKRLWYGLRYGSSIVLIQRSTLTR